MDGLRTVRQTDSGLSAASSAAACRGVALLLVGVFVTVGCAACRRHSADYRAVYIDLAREEILRSSLRYEPLVGTPVEVEGGELYYGLAALLEADPLLSQAAAQGLTDIPEWALYVRFTLRGSAGYRNLYAVLLVDSERYEPAVAWTVALDPGADGSCRVSYSKGGPWLLPTAAWINALKRLGPNAIKTVAVRGDAPATPRSQP